ncbi:conjugal transfer protein TraG N-terminal domain-containing protein [Caulobacter sp. 17J65-9]|uniref:conjugal transfer protein TraG N-terminal domain-containing protein n=1 Tax=Caulobacter sp. 17J65-9 TaxID=2709382 RepID=UPI0013C82924|nr:conjugal transfer protein TraG N-terminal domain-containing protein [Caulobacter sp. 17J65-9]NEX91203.1 hypothetical protein [Caulobacter sp. 17J65-9]
MFEFIAYGGGEYYRDVFNSVAMMAGTNGLSSLIRLAMVLGVLFGLLKMIFDLNLRSMFQWFLTAYIAYAVLWAPKVQVQITDVLNPALNAPVANVPLGVAAVASLTSQVGDRAIQLTELAFGDVNEMRYSETGMIYGAKLVERMRSARITDPIFEQNLQGFISSCVYQDVLTDHISMNQLMRTDDLWSVVRASPNPGVAMTWRNPGGSASEILTCDVVATRLEAGWAVEINNVIRADEKRIRPETPEAELLANGRSGAEAMHRMVMGASRDATDIYRQALMANMLRRGVATYAGETGGSALEVMAETQAEVQTRNLQHIMGGVGERAVPLLKIVVEVMLIGIFPVLFPIFLLPKMGPMMIKGYISGFVGLQAWGPLYVILNKIMMGQAVKESSAAAFFPGELPGLRLSNVEAIGSVNADIASLAGTMLMSIPVLVSMLMRGTFAVGGMGESLMANFRSGAEAAAGAATTGNFSFGNTAFDNHSFMNTSGNKFDTNHSYRAGSSSFEDAGGGMQTIHRDGSFSYQMAQSSTAGSIDATKALSSAAVQRGHQSWEVGNNLNTAASEGVSRTFSDTQRYAESWRTGEASRYAEGSEQRQQEQKVHAELDRIAQDYSQRHGVSNETSRSLVGKMAVEAFGEASVQGKLAPEFFGIGGGLQGRAGAAIRGSLEGSGSSTSAEREATDMVLSKFSDKSWTDSFSSSSAKYAQQSFEKSSSHDRMSANEKADTFASMESLTTTASKYHANAERYEQVAENADTYTQTFKQNYEPQFANWAQGWAERNGVGQGELGALLSGKTPEARAQYARLQEEFAGEALDRMVEMPGVTAARDMASGLDFSSAPQVQAPGKPTEEGLAKGVGEAIPDVRPSIGRGDSLYRGSDLSDGSPADLAAVQGATGAVSDRLSGAQHQKLRSVLDMGEDNFNQFVDNAKEWATSPEGIRTMAAFSTGNPGVIGTAYSSGFIENGFGGGSGAGPTTPYGVDRADTPARADHVAGDGDGQAPVLDALAPSPALSQSAPSESPFGAFSQAGPDALSGYSGGVAGGSQQHEHGESQVPFEAPPRPGEAPAPQRSAGEGRAAEEEAIEAGTPYPSPMHMQQAAGESRFRRD